MKEVVQLREEVGNLKHVSAEVKELKTSMKKLQSSQRPRRPASEVECYNCKKMGHYAYKCPDKREQQGN